MRTLRALFAIALGMLAFSNAAISQTTDTTLSYFDQNTNLNVFFPLPGTFGTTSGADVARTVVAYSERFSSPWPVTLVKTVSIAMRVDRLDNGAVIPVELRKATTIGGKLFADMLSAPLERDTISASMVESGKISYDFAFGRTPMDTTFFVTISAPDTANTRAALRADSHVDSLVSVPARAINDSDRAQLYLDGPYQGAQAWYLSGLRWPFIPDVYDYSNFVITAEVTSETGSVADIYPANADPLTYFVERTRDGETILHYTLHDASLTTLSLFDTRGVKVATLSDDREVAGAHELHIPNMSLPAGMYYAELSAEGISTVRAVAIVR